MSIRKDMCIHDLLKFNYGEYHLVNPMVWQITDGISNDGELLGPGNKLTVISLDLEPFTVVTKSTTKASAAGISSDIFSKIL